MSSSTCCASECMSLLWFICPSGPIRLLSLTSTTHQHAHVCLDLNMTLSNFSGMFSSLMIKTTHKKEEEEK